jgi:hypothetical protein
MQATEVTGRPLLAIGDPDLVAYDAGYVGVPQDVQLDCERLWADIHEFALDCLREIRDKLAPYGTFKVWCAGHGLDYARTQSALSRAYGKRAIDAPSTDSLPEPGTQPPGGSGVVPEPGPSGQLVELRRVIELLGLTRRTWTRTPPSDESPEERRRVLLVPNHQR